MSETIHPGMYGHKLFAEVMAETISGKRVSLADAPPPADSLRFTLARLAAGEPVKIVAMPPYDKIVPEVLAKSFPDARFNVVPWPVEGRSLAEITAWGEGVRAEAEPGRRGDPRFGRRRLRGSVHPAIRLGAGDQPFVWRRRVGPGSDSAFGRPGRRATRPKRIARPLPGESSQAMISGRSTASRATRVRPRTS